MDGLSEFLTVGYSDGSGDGLGYGYNDGSGFRDGSGYGDGYGSGYGSSDGYGSGSGYSDSPGDGYGFRDGSGEGHGDGHGLKSYNGQQVHYIDGLPTLIYSVKGYLAKGAIIADDLTLKDCYVARVVDSFAHGDTVKQAIHGAENKHHLDSPIEDRCNAFLDAFDGVEAIPAKDLSEWHRKLTGSCQSGVDIFIRGKGIDLESDSFTIDEFIDLTRNSYGGGVITELDRIYKNKERKYGIRR